MDKIMNFKKGDKVKVVGGKFPRGSLCLLGKMGVVGNVDDKSYITKKGIRTRIVYVDIADDYHCFNDYHLEKIT